MPTSKVKFDTYREDIVDLGGRLIKEQALFLRASLGMVDYHTVLWDETEEEFEDCKTLLAMAVLNYGRG